MAITIFIYKITNTQNNKVYIGQTIRPIEQRFQRHINDALNNILDTHFARAIRKYGPESFYIEEIDTATTQEELNQKEQYWIRYYNSIQNGYNETDALYKSGGNTYQFKTDEEMKQIQEKIRQSKIGAKNPNSKSVKCLNVLTNEELLFDTVYDCQCFFDEKTHRFITTRVTHQTKTLYRNEWKIAYADDEYGEYFFKGYKTGIQINVLDLLTNEHNTFHSIRAAAKYYHIPRHKMNIQNAGNEFVIDERYQITVLN